MQGSSVRVLAIVPTLLVHGMLLLLFVDGEDVPPRHQVAAWLPVNVWIHLPAASPPEPVLRPASLSLQEVPLALDIDPPLITRSPADAEAPSATQESSETTSVDWHERADNLAARTAEAQERAVIGRPLQKMREPCPSRKSSFAWNPEEERVGILPLPYMMLGERCVIGLGFFTCALGELPEPNKHLFDDMENRRTPDSSVPSPDSCD